MDIKFEGANKEQEELWLFAIEHLLNLPRAAIPLSVMIPFVNSSGFEGNTEGTPFAETLWDYGADAGEIRVRKDAPGFGDSDAGLIAEASSMGLTYDARLHFHETAAHETGHAIFAAIGHEYRLQIAQLFGAQSDSKEELQPAGKEWKDRIGEAIAETFKEAFLPSRYRVFPNRTNIKLSYSKFPTFRRFIREGLGASGESGFDHDVLELDEKNLQVAWAKSEKFVHTGGTQYTNGFEAGFDFFKRTVEVSHTFHFDFLAPLLPVVFDAMKGISYGERLFGFRYLIKVNGVVKDSFRGSWISDSPISLVVLQWFNAMSEDAEEFDDPSEWITSETSLEWEENEGERIFVPDAFGGHNVLLLEDARKIGALPAHISTSVEVSPGDEVVIHCRAVGAEVEFPGGSEEEREEEAKVTMNVFTNEEWKEALPLMSFTAGGEGTPIDIPGGEVAAQGQLSTRVASRGRVQGRLVGIVSAEGVNQAPEPHGSTPRRFLWPVDVNPK